MRMCPDHEKLGGGGGQRRVTSTPFGAPRQQGLQVQLLSPSERGVARLGSGRGNGSLDSWVGGGVLVLPSK